MTFCCSFPPSGCLKHLPATQNHPQRGQNRPQRLSCCQGAFEGTFPHARTTDLEVQDGQNHLPVAQNHLQAAGTICEPLRTALRGLRTIVFGPETILRGARTAQGFAGLLLQTLGGHCANQKKIFGDDFSGRDLQRDIINNSTGAHLPGKGVFGPQPSNPALHARMPDNHGRGFRRKANTTECSGRLFSTIPSSGNTTVLFKHVSSRLRERSIFSNQLPT